MKSAAAGFYHSLCQLTRDITYRAGDAVCGLPDGVAAAAEILHGQTATGRKLMFVGNGASAAISSHMATDFWKTGGMRAVAFNDSSGLTCIGNDYGYAHLFEKPVEMFADPGDVLVAISSSGRSENILRAVSAARSRQCLVLTLSGFDPENPLASLGDGNFHVPVNSYGLVEVLHHSICHCLLDSIVATRRG
ncbi:Phosphoheptose isomerase [Fundidesulfovibrio magnetotacticus]|uniref:Phosphoheptose isomerase n=1 Tax=Fundidesulfovibrio magnetotacticus TaxID=2730080 RepID=A0A6V8LSE3_9BACT|nr:SIS domain-containing protein [Fundidesulfovibrio magnetotacticus]GFK94664.1 Phosphoheptose isomerase [Fundidesulfovibrio magnetotacticus]